MQVIINSPSLNPNENISGISSVTQFIIDNNREVEYIHFIVGRRDGEKGGLVRVKVLLHSLKEWKRLLRKYPDALVHYNFPLARLAVYRDAVFMRYLKGRECVLHVHGGNYLMTESVPCSAKMILKRIFGQSAPFIVLSAVEKKCLTERYHAKDVYVLPNCPDIQKTIERRPLGHDEPLTLGYIGRIVDDKGMKELYDACKSLLKKQTPFMLRLAGVEEVPKYIPMFQTLLGDCFEYVGIVSGKSKRSFLKLLDVFVLPSYYEGLPMSLLESMGYGAVPVVTAVGSISQVVMDGKNGLIIPMYDSDAIVEAICKLNKNRDMVTSLATEARKTVLERFGAEQYVKTLNEIYDRCVIQ